MIKVVNCMEHFGIWSLIPAIFFLVFAIVTRKTITAIVLSGIFGYLIYYKAGFVWPTIEALVESFTDYDNMWIVLVCFLFGCLIRLLRESKGALVFGDIIRKYANTQKKSLLSVWLMGIIIFIDDYLSVLVTANSLMPVVDEHKTPREMLAYVINTTSVADSVIIPISAWVVFFAGVFEAQPETAVIASTGMGVYYKTIPYFVYPFICLIVGPLVIFGIIPKLGGMKTAYRRVEETGKLWPKSSDLLNQAIETGGEKKELTESSGRKPRLWTFLLPMAVVIVITVWQGDILLGVICGVCSCILYLPFKVMSFSEFCNNCYLGLEDMLYICTVLVLSLFYRESMILVGLPEYMIEVVGPLMSSFAGWLPAIAFVAIGLVCFATGNIWSIPAVTTPIIVPLAVAAGASLPLTLGSIISAAVFGAQACFYSDVTLLTSSACKINNVDYAVAQLPYIGIISGITFVIYAAAGNMMI